MVKLDERAIKEMRNTRKVTGKKMGQWRVGEEKLLHKKRAGDQYRLEKT